MTDRNELASRLGPIHIGVRKDLVVTRQELGGRPKYVVHDPVTFQNHAFSTIEYRVLSAIVVGRSLADTFRTLVERGCLETTDEAAFYDFVLALHNMQILQLPITQPEALFERNRKLRAHRRAQWFRAVMYCKIPLLNPDRFLNGTVPYVGWIFSRVGIVLWAALMVCVLWKCLGRFDEMVTESANLLAIANLPVIWIALVLLKVVHEFGHAYACKRLGGEVPEMGAVFIILTPCAYVDASASWKFPDRRQRILVALGGMYVESIVAACGALIWASTQAGLAHDVALNIVVLAGIVTVFLNINPLMKYDGYFVFSDMTGVVNLQERAMRFLKSWVKHWTLGMPRPVAEDSKPTLWLYAIYGPSCFAYRVLLAFGITSLIMTQWPAAGAILGLIFAWMLLVQPVLRLLAYLLRARETVEVRARAWWLTLGGVGITAFLLAFFPVSWSIVVPGTLDPGVRRSIRAPTSGFVTAFHGSDGALVSKGRILCELTNPSFDSRLAEVRGELGVEELRLDTRELEDPREAATYSARAGYLRTHVSQLEQRRESMRVATDVSGTIVTTTPIDLVGRFVHEGEELLQVHSQHRFVRVVLTDKEVARARLEVGSEAEIRWTAAPSTTVTGIVREIRRSSTRSDVPIELTILAGGDIYAKALQAQKAEADQPFLHVFLEVESGSESLAYSGLTAKVRLRARVLTLGGWAQDRLVTFFRNWMMS
ncbi:MAG: hypothetical protein H6832_02990 [Planctomycetes bacterium]|nr:hypothetical protein [Planctomycetota bacterium]MCB9917348.1 hypothetical protein [Planctomycetota bacterium]